MTKVKALMLLEHFALGAHASAKAKAVRLLEDFVLMAGLNVRESPLQNSAAWRNPGEDADARVIAEDDPEDSAFTRGYDDDPLKVQVEAGRDEVFVHMLGRVLGIEEVAGEAAPIQQDVQAAVEHLRPMLGAVVNACLN